MANDKKNAVVTGASYGIGRAVAATLAENGYHVYLLARSVDGLAETQEIVAKLGGSSSVVKVDLTDTQAVAGAFKQISAEGKKLDVLWSGAFGYIDGPLVDVEMVEVTDLFGAGVIGAISVTKNFLENATDNPSIFLVSADWNFPENNGLSAFISAKKAVEGYGIALQKELHGKAKVCVVCPADVSSHSHSFDATPDAVFEDTKGAAIATIELAQLCVSFLGYKTLFVPKIYIHPLDQNYSVTFAT